MTHSNLLRVFSYLGFQGSRKVPNTNSVIAVSPSLIPVPSHSRIQLVDIWSPLWQPHHYYTTRSKGNSRMGQAGSSFVRAYAGADENANERPKEGIDNKDPKGDEGSVDENDNSANDASAVDVKGGDAECEVKQKASVDVLDLVERIPEGVVSPEDALTSQLDQKLEKDLVSEKGKPAETADVKKNAAGQIALNLVVDELGEPPERPLPGDCCGQGCDVCVWDSYNDELRDYLARKKALLKKSK